MRKIISLIIVIVILLFSSCAYAVDEEGNGMVNNTNTQEPAEENPNITPEPETPSENETTTPEPENPPTQEPEDTPTQEPEVIEPTTGGEPEQEQPTENNNSVQPPETPEENQENTPPVDNSNTNTYYPPELSSNNYLSSLEVVDNTIEPEFDRYTTEYYLLVGLEVEELEIYAYPADDNAIVNIYGNEELKEGENEISIIVTAEDGTTRYYTIYVTKTEDAEKSNAKLKKLEVKGYNLSPSFTGIIFKYNLTIDENTQQLYIIAEPENENAIVTIEGNENLAEGNNLIKIIVTAEDGQTKREYKINTIVKSANVEIVDENKLPAIIAIVVCIVFIIAIFIYVISKKK